MSVEGYRIAVFAGDGIGREITEPCVALVEKALARTGAPACRFEWLEAGAAIYVETGTALPDASLKSADRADAILLSAMGDPSVRYADGTEIVPQIELRFALDLYAGVRPVRSIPGVPPVLAGTGDRPLDFVLVRESTEGLFSSFGKGVVEKDRASDRLEITRAGTERLTRFSLELARERKQRGHKGRLTLVDKANVFASFAFMRDVFDGIAADAPDIETDHAYVDACALDMVRRPWDFDVLVTENMFGDILSDLGAGLMGGLGFAPSADIGPRHAVFQPCHGSAPDIAGKGVANPTAMFLSAAMMLDWLARRHGDDATAEAGRAIERAVDAAFRPGTLRTSDLGGSSGLGHVCEAVFDALEGA